MTDPKSTDAINDIRHTLGARLHTLKVAQAAERLQREQGQAEPWIVVSAFGLALAFTQAPMGRLASPVSTDAHRAKRFDSEAEAQAVANLVTDGTGARARAVPLDRALAADIAGLEGLLVTVDQHLASLKAKS